MAINTDLKGLVAGTVSEAAIADQLNQFRKETIDRPLIYVGAGTCGLGAGAAATIEEIKKFLDDKGFEADVVETGCIGLCVMEPIVEVQLPGKNRIMYGHVNANVVSEVLGRAIKGQVDQEHVLCQHRSQFGQAYEDVPFIDEYPFFAPQTRWVLANCGLMDPTSMEEYIARGGYQALKKSLNLTPGQICDEVELSGLRGRGGGGFPTGKKWKFASGTAADQKYLVCNADEGDPGAFMDRAVIEGDPHRLLEGMAIAAYAIGATKAYIYIRAEYPLAIDRLYKAIDQATEYGYLGDNIMGTDFSLHIKIKKGAGAFVCGEETALLQSIEGKRGMPRPRPPFPAVSGAFGKPTIINNVETLANVPHVMAAGGAECAKLGTGTSKGTKVFALSGKVKNTGLVEVAMGTTMREIIFSIGGGCANGKKFKAVQIGGPSGGCIPFEHLDIEIDYETLKTVGAMMGSGGLVVMDEDNCMVDVAKFFMDFIQRESCGKCTPCRSGTRRMLEQLQRITKGTYLKENGLTKDDDVLAPLVTLAETIRDTALCGLGQTAPNPILSTIRWFRDEYEAHIYEGKCPAGVCRTLVQYKINPDLCKGCTACARKCPGEAIYGAPKSPHVINPDLCIKCGACLETCKFGAIYKE